MRVILDIFAIIICITILVLFSPKAESQPIPAPRIADIYIHGPVTDQMALSVGNSIR